MRQNRLGFADRKKSDGGSIRKKKIAKKIYRCRSAVNGEKWWLKEKKKTVATMKAAKIFYIFL